VRYEFCWLRILPVLMVSAVDFKYAEARLVVVGSPAKFVKKRE
jgi:hypothetical protein